MKRKQILQKLGFEVPPNRTRRVILDTDVANEADDPFAIMQHLLTPSEDVLGIVATHHEFFHKLGVNGFNSRGKTADINFEAGKKLLEIAQIDDVPLFKGQQIELQNPNEITPNSPVSQGVQFIIDQALDTSDTRPLYVCFLGAITDMAAALLKEPSIADKLTCVWIGGGAYPQGCAEFNLMGDVIAANVVLKSGVELWQVPQNDYRKVRVSISELKTNVEPCGQLGKYLFDQLTDFNLDAAKRFGESTNGFPHGEVWSIGDNPTCGVFLQGDNECEYDIMDAHAINDDFTYGNVIPNRKIKVYKYIDNRLIMGDLFSKLKLCYGELS